MPIPIEGTSSAAPAWPIVTKPTCCSSLMAARACQAEAWHAVQLWGKPQSCEPPGGRVGAQRLLDDQRPQELDALLAAVLLRHDRILVLEREHVVVALLEQRGHHALPRHVAPAGDAVAGGAVGALPGAGRGDAVDVEDVLLELPVLRVRVEDPLAESLDEDDRVDHLPDQVARVEVEAPVVAAEPLDRLLRRVDVVGDLRRVHLVREADAELGELVEDRAPALDEQVPALFVDLEPLGRPDVPALPHGRAEEADDGLDLELARDARGLEDVLGAELDHLLLVGGARPLVEARVAEREHHLREEVVRERRDLEPLVGEHLLDPLRVGDVLRGLVRVEVIRAAPRSQLDHLVAEAGRVVGHLFERLVVEQHCEQPDLHAPPSFSAPRRGSKTYLIAFPARRSSKTRSHASSGTTSLTSGSSSTRRSSTNASARRQERAVEAKPEVTTSSFWKTASSGTVTGFPKTPTWT